MANLLRSLGAIFVAMVVAIVLLIAVEGFSAIVHPFPEDFGGTPEEVVAHVARYPQWVLAAAVPMWGFTGFLSTWVAGRLGNHVCALAIGVLLMAAVMYNLSMLPYPLWFKAVMPVVLAGAIVAGYRLSLSPRPMAAQTPDAA